MAESTRSCPRCGTKNPPARLFCTSCGTRLATSEADLIPTYREQRSEGFDGDVLDPLARPRRQRFWLLIAGGMRVLLAVSAGVLGLWQWQARANEQASAADTPALPTPSVAVPTTPTTGSEVAALAGSPEVAPQQTAASIQTATAIKEMFDATEIPEQTTTAQAAYAERTATADAEQQATAALAQQTVTAGSAQTATAQAASVAAADEEMYTLADLPIYSDAQPVSDDDPFVQGMNDTLLAQQTSLETTTAAVYRVPPGVDFNTIVDFYVNALDNTDWVAPALPHISTENDELEQNLLVWVRNKQRFVLTYVTGDTVADATGGGGYLVLTLVTVNE